LFLSVKWLFKVLVVQLEDVRSVSISRKAKSAKKIFQSLITTLNEVGKNKHNFKRETEDGFTPNSEAASLKRCTVVPAALYPCYTVTP